MNDDPIPEELPVQEPPNLRFLRVLVTVLTITMIGGLIAVFSVIVIRFPSTSASLALPSEIVLPDGVEAEAVTLMRDRVLVVSGNEILVFSAEGTLLQRVVLQN
ncbi:MAG: hypothetical protein ACI9KS_000294 [Sulfitobacter sp.]|jgi:hypothetical protein